MAQLHLQEKSYNKDEITEQLLEIFSYYRSFRQQYEKRALRDYGQYVGYVEEIADKKANVHIPKAYQVIDTLRSHIVANFFHKRPYINFIPSPAEAGALSSLAANEEKAKVAAALVDEQLELCSIQREFYDFVSSILVYPAGILGVGWRYEQERVRRKARLPVVNGEGDYTGSHAWGLLETLETVYDDNEVINIDFFDFWTDPEASRFSEARGCFHREFVTFEELEEKVEQLEALREGILYPLDMDRIREEVDHGDDGLRRRPSSPAVSLQEVDPYLQSRDERLSAKSNVELLHYWERDRHAILVHRVEPLYDGPNPYWRHGELPFCLASYDRLPNEIYGLSAMQIIHDMQEEINTLHNQRLDNASLNINNMWLRTRGSDISEEQLVSRPNGIIDVDNPDDLQPLKKNPLPQEAFVAEETLNKDLEDSLGTPPTIRGVEGHVRQTATEVSTTTDNALGRFESKIRLLEESVINRMARQMDLNNQQFISDTRLARINVENEEEWREVRPEDLVGEFDYSPARNTTDLAANKEIRREQLSEVINMMLRAGVPFMDYPALIMEWLETLDLQNPDKFLASPDKRKRLEEQYLAQLLSRNMRHERSPGEDTNRDQEPRRVSGGQSITGQPQPQPGLKGVKLFG